MSNNDWATVGSSFGFNALFCAAVVPAYLLLSVKLPKLYNARFHCPLFEKRSLSASASFTSALETVRAAVVMSEEEYLRRVGLDAYMLTRYIRLCARFSFFSMLFAFIVLLPVYASAKGEENGMFKFSASNLRSQGNDDNNNDNHAKDFGGVRVSFVIITAWVIVLWFLYDLDVEYRLFVRLRQRYLERCDDSVEKQSRYTVMVENIPPLLRSDRALQVFFDRMFPRGVHSAAVCLNIDTLIDLCDRRARVRERLALCRLKEESSDEVATHTTCDCVVPTLRNWPLFCCKRRRLPSVETYRSELQRLDRRIDEERKRKNDARTTMRKRDDQLEHKGALSDVLERVVQRTKSLARKLGEDEDSTPPLTIKVGGGSHDVASEGDDNSTSAFDPDGGRGDTDDSASKTSEPTTLRRAADVSMGVLASSGNFVGRSAATMVHRAAVGVSVVGHVVEDIALGSDSCSTGFVTFRRLEDAATASQVLLSPIPDSLDTTVAPQPRDLIWENVAVPKTQVETRTMLVDIALGVGAILWSTIVSFIYFLGSLDTLSKLLTFLNEFKDSALYISVQGWLPGMLLLAVIALLPSAFDFISERYERTKLRSQIEEKTFCRYFIYNMSNIYVTVIVGSIFEDLKHIIDHPQELMNTLAASIPKVAVYFTCLIIIKATSGLALEMLNVGALVTRLACGLKGTVFGCFLTVVGGEDGRSIAEMDKEEEEEDAAVGRRARVPGDAVPRYSQIYGDILLVLIVCLTYAVLFPLLLPFGCLYFALSWCVRRFRALVFHTPAYESGGELFYKVFDRTIVGLYFAVSVTMSYILTKSPSMSPFLFPILIVVWCFHRRCHFRYERPSRNLSRMLAIQRCDDRDLPLRSDVAPVSKSRRDAERPLLTAAAVSSKIDLTESEEEICSLFSETLYRQTHLCESPMQRKAYQRPSVKNTSEGGA